MNKRGKYGGYLLIAVFLFFLLVLLFLLISSFTAQAKDFQDTIYSFSSGEGILNSLTQNEFLVAFFIVTIITILIFLILRIKDEKKIIYKYKFKHK